MGCSWVCKSRQSDLKWCVCSGQRLRKVATKTETVKKIFSFPLFLIFLPFPFFLSKEEKKSREEESAKHLSCTAKQQTLISLSTLSNHLDFGERIDVDAPYPSPLIKHRRFILSPCAVSIYLLRIQNLKLLK